MTDDTQSNDHNEPEGPLAGERLAAARRERDISIFDIAKELHLDEPKVQALEQNKFETLGAPVFAKGHLRKYAELVGVPVDDVLADYYTLNRAVGAPPVVGPPRKHQRDIRIGPWIVGIAAILAAATVIYWWLGRDAGTPAASVDSGPDTGFSLPTTTPTAIDSTDQQTTADMPPALADTEVTDDSQTEDLLPSTTTDVAGSANSSAASEPRPTTGGPQVTLGIRFSGECWTEVSDASGTRLFFDLGRAGRTVSVTGDAPLRVLFGNSDNVTVTVDGSDFPIPASMRRGQTARLTINNQ